MAMKAKRQVPRTIAIRALVFQDGNWLAVRCLEYDLATQARTLPRLYEGLRTLILGHIALRLHHRQQPFESLKPAPSKYWEMFERSRIPLSDETRRFAPVRRSGFVVPPPQFRVAPPEAA